MYKWFRCKTHHNERNTQPRQSIVEPWELIREEHLFPEQRITVGQQLIIDFTKLAEPMKNQLSALFMANHTQNDQIAGKCLEAKYLLLSDYTAIHKAAKDLETVQKTIEQIKNSQQ